MATFREIKGKGRHKRRWRAQVYLGKHPETGGARFKTAIKATRDEAEKWARKYEVKRDDGVVKPTLTKSTLTQYLRDVWLPMHRNKVRSTYSTEKILGKWIFLTSKETPDVVRLGDRKLTSLEAADFNKLYSQMYEKYELRRGVSFLHGVLKQAFRYAVDVDLLARNVVAKATLPNFEAKKTGYAPDADSEVEALTAEQEERFRAAARDDRLCAFWHLMLCTGLRPGEAFALQWRHIDFDAKLVRVRGTLVRVGVNKQEQGWLIHEPKTENSNREVPINDTTLAMLRQWKDEQHRERQRMGPEYEELGFVFSNEFGRPLGNNITRAFNRMLRKADGGKGDLGTWGPEQKKPRSGPTAERPFVPKFRLYSLRHTFATLALLDGVPLLDVSRVMGHSNMAFTAKVYGHLQAKQAPRAAQEAERRWNGGLQLVA